MPELSTDRGRLPRVSKRWPPRLRCCLATPRACFRPGQFWALLNGCTILVGNDAGFWRKWGVNYVCGSPQQVADRFRDVAPGRKFRRIKTRGSRLSDSDAEVLLAHIEQVIDIYGARETNKSSSNVLTRNAEGTIRRGGRKLDSEIEIANQDSQLAAEGGTGLVRVRNPYQAAGYLGQPEKTARSFRDGRFYPGDIGAWTPDGALDIIGREDNLMSSAGGNPCRADRHDAVAGGVGLATNDRMVAIAGLLVAALVGADFTTVGHFVLRVPALRPTHFLRSPETSGLDDVPFREIDTGWSPRFGLGSQDGGALRPGYASDTAVAWIVQSSGTTGQPKFMQLSAGLLLRRVHAVMTEFEPGRIG